MKGEKVSDFRKIYNQVMLILRTIEVVDLEKLEQQLSYYLIVLANQHSGLVLDLVSAGRDRPGNYIYIANCVLGLAATIKEIESFVGVIHPFEKNLLDDNLRQLKYYQAKLSKNKRATSIKHVVGFINEFIANEPKRPELRVTISGYLGEQGVDLTLFNNDEAWCQARVQRLNQTSVIVQLKHYFRQAKRALLQCDIFLKKFNSQLQAAATQLKPSVLELKNYKEKVKNASQKELGQIENMLASSDQASNDSLEQLMGNVGIYRENAAVLLMEIENTFNVADSLLTKEVVGRFFKKFDTAHVGQLLDKFENYTGGNSSKEMNVFHSWRQDKTALGGAIEERSKQLVDIALQKKVDVENKLCEQLQDRLTSVQGVCDNAYGMIALVRHQLSCAAEMKKAYGKYSLAIIFKHAVDTLASHDKELVACAQAIDIPIQWDLLQVSSTKIENIKERQVQAASEATLAQSKINEYIDVINYNVKDYPDQKFPAWQIKLNEMITHSSSQALEGFFTQLQAVTLIENKYQRALLIMCFAQVQKTLSIKIISSMRHWGHKNCSKAVVKNTLNYIGLTISDETLYRIAPHLKPLGLDGVIDVAWDSCLAVAESIPTWMNNIFHRKV